MFKRRKTIKWFQHISDSLDDPFIRELITDYGPTGYMVFFGTLEVLCREDAFELPFECKINYFSDRMRLQSRTVLKVINFCKLHNRFEVEIKDDRMSIFCPKLITLRDYKHRMKPKKKGQSLPKSYPLEKEIEKDIDIDTYKTLVDKWNDNKYKKISKLSSIRIKHLKSRLKEKEFDIDKIIEKVNKAKVTDFIKNSSWFTFDWIIKNDTNYIKLLEGNYDPKQQPKADDKIEGVTFG